MAAAAAREFLADLGVEVFSIRHVHRNARPSRDDALMERSRLQAAGYRDEVRCAVPDEQATEAMKAEDRPRRKRRGRD